jgi:hypothetical protein
MDAEVLAALKRLSQAASSRETIMGDVSSLLDAKAELAAARKAADAVITKNSMTQNEIARLNALLDECRVALKPLADKWLHPDDIDKDMSPGARIADEDDFDLQANDGQVDDVWIKRADIRRARNVLAKLGEKAT